MNWDARLKRAEKQGKFAKADRDLAGPWLSCAVGERSGQYREWKAKNAEPGTPLSGVLSALGFDFYYDVAHDNVDFARDAYDAIQAWFQRYGKAA